MKVVFFGNEYLGEHAASIKILWRHCVTRGMDVRCEQSLHAWFAAADPMGFVPVRVATARDIATADVIVSLGGDGTLLRTAHATSGLGRPIVGINAGHLGYLTAASLDDAETMMDAIAAGEYRIEQRRVLQVHTPAVTIERPFALNEVALLRQDTSSVIEMDTTLRGLPLTTYKGDGLVISTPTGSTAYNMSAGGPILEPTTRCLVLTPVSPHALTMRPLVVGDDSEITVTTRSRAPHYLVSIDGESIVLPTGSTVTVRVAPHTVNVIMPLDNNYAATLRAKLLWGQ